MLYLVALITFSQCRIKCKFSLSDVCILCWTVCTLWNIFLWHRIKLGLVMKTMKMYSYEKAFQWKCIEDNENVFLLNVWFTAMLANIE